MKCIIIRNAAVNVKPPARMNSTEFDAFCAAYDEAPIVTVTEQSLDTHRYLVFVGESARARETAQELFREKDWTETALLNEVPLRSFKDTRVRYPYLYWNLRARLQWYFNNERQTETREQTKKRCAQLMHLVQQSTSDVLLVSHALFIRVFLSYCKQNKYEVTRYGGFRIAPLERIRITERDAHCGHCIHNCLLSDPGCDIGRETAALGKQLLF